MPFITLTGLESEIMKINPQYIVMMIEDVYDKEDGTSIPITKIYTTLNQHTFALETIEQIDQLQIRD